MRRLLKRLRCLWLGHSYRFNSGDPLCMHCGYYQFMTRRRILPAYKNKDGSFDVRPGPPTRH